MRQVVSFVAAATLGLLLVASPAAAQSYGGGGGGGGDTVDHNRRTDATVTPRKVRAGEQATFRTANDTCFGPADIFLVRSSHGSQATQVGNDVPPNGQHAVSQTFTVPANAQPGVYYVYAICRGEDGEDVVAITPLVVAANPENPPSAQGFSGQRFTPPASVQAVQVPPSVEAAAAEAAARGATVELTGTGLATRGGEAAAAGRSSNRRGLALTGGDIAAIAGAGLAALLVGVGLVSLRRRPRGVQS